MSIQVLQTKSIDSRGYVRQFQAKLMEIIVYQSNDSKYIQQIELVYPEKNFKFEEKTTKLQSKTIKIGDEEYLQRVSYETDKNGFITWIKFAIYHEDNILREEEFGKNGDNKLTHHEADEGYRISGMKFIKQNFLTKIEYDQYLIDKYQPDQLVTTQNQHNKNLVYNYLEIKVLEELVPCLIFCQDQEFKNLYNDLLKEISIIQKTKRQISDDLQMICGTFKKIISKHGEIYQLLDIEFSKEYGKFSIKNYEKQCESLKIFQNDLTQIQENLEVHEKSLNQLKDESSSKNVKRNYIKAKDMETSASTSQFMKNQKNIKEAQKEIIALESKYLIFKENSKQFENKYKIIQDSIEKSQIIIKELKQDLTKEIKQTNEILSKVNTKNVTAIQDSDDIELQNELAESLQKSEENYQIVKNLIKSKIQNELKKIESGMTIKKLHIIIMVDESGSMAGDWVSVQETVNNFIKHFATTNNESHLFSVILFDDKCRYITKREKASNVKNLPNLSGGGTIFEPAFKLGAQFVNELTPQDCTPVIIFMTDGQTSDDIKLSLDQLKICRQKPNFMFFAIGFGQAYNKQSLDQLSNAGNNYKQSFKVGKNDIQFVYDTIDNKQLQNVFDTFQENFDFAEQKNVIQILNEQLEREKKEFKDECQFINMMNQQKAQQKQQRRDQLIKFNKLSTEAQQKGYQKVIEDQIFSYNQQLDGLYEQQQEITEAESIKKSTQQFLKDEIDKKKKEIEGLEQKQEEIRKKSVTSEKNRDAKIQEYLEKSGFSSEDKSIEFTHQMKYIQPTLQSLTNVIKNGQELTKIFCYKIKDIQDMFEKIKENQKQKTQETKNLTQSLKTRYPQQFKTDCQLPKDVVLELLETRNKNDFKQYILYYKNILNKVDLMDFVFAGEAELMKIAQEQSQKLLIDDMNNDTQDNEVDVDGNADTMMKQINAGDQKNKKLNNYETHKTHEFDEADYYFQDNQEKEDLPKTTSQLQNELKRAKIQMEFLRKKMKQIIDLIRKDQNSQDNKTEILKLKTQYDQIKSRIQLLEELSNPNVVQANIMKCLREINEFIQEAYGNEIKKGIYEEFKIIFNKFGEDVRTVYNGIQQSNQYLTIEIQCEFDSLLKAQKSNQPSINHQRIKY